MRPIETAVVLVIAALSIGWIGPLAWALLDRAGLLAF